MPVTTATASTAPDIRVRGRVAWFSHKGFGFLETEDGRDVYVHHSAIVGTGFRTLPAGADVAFRIQHEARGPEARDVEITDDSGGHPGTADAGR